MDEGVGATAAVLRDERELFDSPMQIHGVVTSEAMAMRDGLIFPNSLGFPRVEAGSDSSTMIEYCMEQTRRWDAPAIIFAKRVDISLLIGNVVFKHCVCSSSQGL